MRSAEIAFAKEIIKCCAPICNVDEAQKERWEKKKRNLVRCGLIGGGAAAGGAVFFITG